MVMLYDWGPATKRWLAEQHHRYVIRHRARPQVRRQQAAARRERYHNKLWQEEGC